MEDIDTKRMAYNLGMLEERIIDTLKVSDLKRIQEELSNITGTTFCLGAGGSKVVADFASKVLSFKNECLTSVGDVVDLYSANLKLYKNAFICSYSGNNHGVNEALKAGLKSYLLTTGEGDFSIRYSSSLSRERSFISLGGTLMPMAILLSYYLGESDTEEVIKEMFTKKPKFIVQKDDNFHIFSSLGTSIMECFLESTLVESGIGRATIHHKYDYCHGRSTLLKEFTDSILYCETIESDIDRTIKEAIHNYRQKIILKSSYKDPVLDNFFLVLQGIYLASELAKLKGIDLSKIDYDIKAVPKLYKFSGSLK